MNLTVFTGTDTAEAGPTLDDAPTSVGWYGASEDADDARVRFAFSSSVPNIDAPDDDSGLWTVVLSMTVGEAQRLAHDIARAASASMRGEGPAPH